MKVGHCEGMSTNYALRALSVFLANYNEVPVLEEEKKAIVCIVLYNTNSLLLCMPMGTMSNCKQKSLLLLQE